VRVDNVPLYDCSVHFFLNKYTSIHFERLKFIYVSKPNITSENYDAIMSFLQRYKISFRDNYMILEK
jgi:hypothetical protein